MFTYAPVAAGRCRTAITGWMFDLLPAATVRVPPLSEDFGGVMRAIHRRAAYRSTARSAGAACGAWSRSRIGACRNRGAWRSSAATRRAGSRSYRRGEVAESWNSVQPSRPTASDSAAAAAPAEAMLRRPVGVGMAASVVELVEGDADEDDGRGDGKREQEPPGAFTQASGPPRHAEAGLRPGTSM